MCILVIPYCKLTALFWGVTQSLAELAGLADRMSQRQGVPIVCLFLKHLWVRKAFVTAGEDARKRQQWSMSLSSPETSRWNTAEEEVKKGWNGFWGLVKGGLCRMRVGWNVHVGSNKVTLSKVAQSDNWDLFWWNGIPLLACWYTYHIGGNQLCVCVCHLLFSSQSDTLGQTTSHKNRAVSCTHGTIAHTQTRQTSSFHINPLPIKGNFPHPFPV